MRPEDLNVDMFEGNQFALEITRHNLAAHQRRQRLEGLADLRFPIQPGESLEARLTPNLTTGGWQDPVIG